MVDFYGFNVGKYQNIPYMDCMGKGILTIYMGLWKPIGFPYKIHKDRLLFSEGGMFKTFRWHPIFCLGCLGIG